MKCRHSVGRFVRPFRAKPPVSMAVARQLLVFQKAANLLESKTYKYGKEVFPYEWAESYWDDKHSEHSEDIR